MLFSELVSVTSFGTYEHTRLPRILGFLKTLGLGTKIVSALTSLEGVLKVASGLQGDPENILGVTRGSQEVQGGTGCRA